MDQAPKKKIKLICFNCDQVFDRVQRLQSHQAACSTICFQCKVKFRTRAQLLCHQRNSVLQDCDQCDRKFCGESDYNHHQETTHPPKCRICCKGFSSLHDLEKHGENATPQECDQCNKVFCQKNELKQHMVSEHPAESKEDEEYTNLLKQIIAPSMGFEVCEGYKKMVEGHEPIIKDGVNERKNILMTVNKQLRPSAFTYKDLSESIENALNKRRKACRFNIGFGFILKNKLVDEYRYCYVCTNTLLFDHAPTISTKDDVKDILKDLYGMNIIEDYSTPLWVVAGLTNVQFKLMYLVAPLV